ncbi:hypothetical protein COCCADRAFT_113639 [Bipolaris zeicola 26-R-13]|uniref:Amino acid permease/ SLC12A domain-containing protein n=1 Tax=Cochliobolus carbonum (strain 26-R-13) TaxID=930089 RepID=W6XVA2_COCC2|nr:uncharacterized protein COCCADRAFT_113639 [Bipolaris zeicola 26-R-13]EUC26689.1 hypothetical protein COCCADRAFT_113639 [Bipolaris zeicola 26-R-13]
MATESGTTQDQSDMQQLGIEQKLNRNFSIYTLLGFALLIGNNWVYALIGNGVSLQNGGPAGGIWMLCVVLCGMLAVTLCIAEQTSMHPSSGGPYVWVGIHLPGRWGKCISYVVGWLTFLGWQAGMAGTCFLTGEQIRGLIALISSSYKPAPMHSTLLCISVATFAIIWNTLLAKYLPYGEGLMIIPYMMVFVAFLSVLIVMGPKSDATEIFLEFKDPSGWGNTAVATMVGMIAPILTMGSGDATTHLAEEVKNASQSNPKATIIGFLTNSLGALSMSIVLFLRQGNDYAALIGTPYGQPWIQTLVDATGSEPIAAAMLGLVCVLLLVTRGLDLYFSCRVPH